MFYPSSLPPTTSSLLPRTPSYCVRKMNFAKGNFASDASMRHGGEGEEGGGNCALSKARKQIPHSVNASLRCRRDANCDCDGNSDAIYAWLRVPHRSGLGWAPMVFRVPE